jgi:hypothetical protein
MASSLLGASEVPEWSAPKAEALDSADRKELIDGIESHWLELQGRDLKIKWFVGGDWFVRRARGDSSITFVQRLDPNLQMRLYVFPATGALPDLKEGSLLAYARSIPNQFKGTQLSKDSLSFQRPGLGKLLLLDSGYRKISYTLIPEDDSGPNQHVCDLLALMDDGRMVVLRFIGTEAFLRSIESNLDAEISRFLLEMG